MFGSCLYSQKTIEDYTAWFSKDTVPVMHSLKISFFGVSTLLIDDGNTQILIDGYFTRSNMWKVATSHVQTDTNIVNFYLEKYKINRLKAIFVTHSHIDHALDIAYVSKKTNSTIYGSSSTIQIGKGGNVKTENLVEFNNYETFKLDGFTIEVLPGKHTKPGFYNNDIGKKIEDPLCQPTHASNYVEGGSYDFYISHSYGNLYIKPSTNYIDSLIFDKKVDILFLGIALLGKSKKQFKDKYYEETVKKFIPTKIIPIHWDNFFIPLNKGIQFLPSGFDKTDKAMDYLITRVTNEFYEFEILMPEQTMYWRRK